MLNRAFIGKHLGGKAPIEKKIYLTVGLKSRFYYAVSINIEELRLRNDQRIMGILWQFSVKDCVINL